MKIISLSVLLLLYQQLLSQNRYLNKQDRSFFSNEIFISGNGFWNFDIIEFGLGYERTIFRLKNKKTDYFSWQNEAMFEVSEITNFSLQPALMLSGGRDSYPSIS